MRQQVRMRQEDTHNGDESDAAANVWRGDDDAPPNRQASPYLSRRIVDIARETSKSVARAVPIGKPERADFSDAHRRTLVVNVMRLLDQQFSTVE